MPPPSSVSPTKLVAVGVPKLSVSLITTTVLYDPYLRQFSWMVLFEKASASTSIGSGWASRRVKKTFFVTAFSETWYIGFPFGCFDHGRNHGTLKSVSESLKSLNVALSDDR